MLKSKKSKYRMLLLSIPLSTPSITDLSPKGSKGFKHNRISIMHNPNTCGCF